MTAMREARGDSASADPINGTHGKANVNDRKFAFLNQITRPDYRSLPTSAATSQSSVPSTPVTVPLKTNGTEQIIFREFGAPIATPEDEELIDDLEIKSEPLLSPRRTFSDFEDNNSEGKENRQNDTDADTTIREDIEDVEKIDKEMKTSEITINEEDNILKSFEEKEQKKFEEFVSNSKQQGEVESKQQSEKLTSIDFIRMVESAPELTNPFQEKAKKGPSEEEIRAEEIRRMTESFGEPRKAVIERVSDTVDDTDDDETETETETETENEEMDDDDEDIYDDVRRQIAAVSDIPMVFGWNGKSNKEKMDKPTSLPLRYEVEAECSTPRRAEFSIDLEDDEPSDDPAQSASSCDEGLLQQSLLQLQKQLRKTDVRCSRLEKICEFQQRDIDSLRFEVDWKDKRIEYLQKTLQEMELSHTDASSSRSTSTS